jgi:hypothetical protein
MRRTLRAVATVVFIGVASCGRDITAPPSVSTDPGVDYSFARPGIANIKAAGYDFVGRYLTSFPLKRIEAAEVSQMKANGLALVLLFEDDSINALLGYNQGTADAQEALQQANAIGFPGDRPVYFTVDFDATTAARQDSVDQYLRGAASVIGANRVGVYGGYYVVQRALNNGTAAWAWQTRGFSGGGLIDSRIHIYQKSIQSAFNGNADIDVPWKADFGQWIMG